MGIAKAQFNNILSNIFKSGNIIRLFKTMPDASTETGGEVVGSSYTIQSGDFTVSGGQAYSVKNMPIYLCETSGGDGIAVGFGVYYASTLYYFGEFSEPMTISYNTYPTIKKYDSAKGEGIKVTLTSTDIS